MDFVTMLIKDRYHIIFHSSLFILINNYRNRSQVPRPAGSSTEIQRSRLTTKKGLKTRTPYNSDKKQKPRLSLKSNGVLGDRRTFLHLV